MVLGLGLACSGLGLSPGTPIATANATSGSAASLQVTAPADGSAALWLTYDLDFTSGWSIDGPLTVSVAGNPVRAEVVSYDSERGPLVGNNTRVTFGTSESIFNGRGSASGSVKLLVVQDLKAGDRVQVDATLTVAPGVTANVLELGLSQ